MADVFSKRKRSEVMSRIRADLRQPFGRSGESAPDESAQACDVQPIPHPPQFGCMTSKLRGNVSDVRPDVFETFNPQPSTV